MLNLYRKWTMCDAVFAHIVQDFSVQYAKGKEDTGTSANPKNNLIFWREL